MAQQRQYMVARTVKTLSVYRVTASNPTEAAMKIALGVERKDLEPIKTQTLQDSYGSPQVAVADPAESAHSDMNGAEDHQNGEADHDAENEPAKGAHAGTVPPSDPGQTLAL